MRTSIYPKQRILSLMGQNENPETYTGLSSPVIILTASNLNWGFMRNPNWKFYKLTARSKAALERLSTETGVEQTTQYLRRANNKRMREARERISLAVSTLVADGYWISISEIARTSKCSRKTVIKHADLWRNYYSSNTNYGLVVAS